MTKLLVNIDVPDIEKALRFYTSALPLHMGRRFDEEFVELLGGSSPIYLLKKNSGTQPFPGSTDRRDYGPHWCPVHLDFIVESIAEAREKLISAGATEEVPVKLEKYGYISMFRDPFGHGLCLIQLVGRGYDELLN